MLPQRAVKLLAEIKSVTVFIGCKYSEIKTADRRRESNGGSPKRHQAWNTVKH